MEIKCTKKELGFLSSALVDFWGKIILSMNKKDFLIFVLNEEDDPDEFSDIDALFEIKGKFIDSEKIDTN